MKDPCGDCWLKYSSYCCECSLKMFGLGLVSTQSNQKGGNRGEVEKAQKD